MKKISLDIKLYDPGDYIELDNTSPTQTWLKAFY